MVQTSTSPLPHLLHSTPLETHSTQFHRSNSGHNDNDGGQRCKGVTFSKQSKLPRLPIPPLDETLTKFLSTVEPLLGPKEMKQTQDAVEAFLSDPEQGPALQKALVDYNQVGFESGKLGSYVEEFWNEAYLAANDSVVLNVNPFFVLEDGPDPKISKDQLCRASSLCFAAIQWASALRNETIAPDAFKGQPLCMDQYRVLFGASRQPTLDCNDSVELYNDSFHVAVLCNNEFYYFPVLWPGTGRVAVDEADVLDILTAIQRNAEQKDTKDTSRTAIGVFTSVKRSEWAQARQELVLQAPNEASLRVIDSALFVLVLDDVVPTDVDAAAANMLHGTSRWTTTGRDGGSIQVGSCINRWYDKLQLIVCKDGTCGVNFEHSAVDGHTALRFVSDVYAETVIRFAETIVDAIHGRGHVQHVVKAEVVRAATVLDDQGLPQLDVLPKKLVFELPESFLQRIYFYQSILCDDLSGNETSVLEFKDYGKQLIVANKMSPDSFVQMSMLLAYYKLYGTVVCMYEPVLTKVFYHGRTEAMRTVTQQAKDLCILWCNSASTSQQKLEALIKATKEHSRLVKECAQGKGVDRHLYSLQCMAERQQHEAALKFFENPGWKTLNHTILSTSNCGNSALRLFGFGPVVPNGFGIGYIIKDNGLSYAISSRHRQNGRFVQSLQTTLREMRSILGQQSLQNARVSLLEVQQPLNSALKQELLQRRRSADSVQLNQELLGLSEANDDGTMQRPEMLRRRSSIFRSVRENDMRNMSSALEILADTQISVELDFDSTGSAKTNGSMKREGSSLNQQ